MAMNVMSNDRTTCPMIACSARAGDRPLALPSGHGDGAGIGSTLDSIQQ